MIHSIAHDDSRSGRGGPPEPPRPAPRTAVPGAGAGAAHLTPPRRHPPARTARLTAAPGQERKRERASPRTTQQLRTSSEGPRCQCGHAEAAQWPSTPRQPPGAPSRPVDHAGGGETGPTTCPTTVPPTPARPRAPWSRAKMAGPTGAPPVPVRSPARDKEAAAAQRRSGQEPRARVTPPDALKGRFGPGARRGRRWRAGSKGYHWRVP